MWFNQAVKPEIEADYEVVQQPFRVPWAGMFWWAVYVTGFAGTAVEMRSEPIVVVTMVVGAALIVPAWRVLSAARWRTTEGEQQSLLQRQAHERASYRAMWAARGARLKRRLALPHPEQ